MIPMAKPIVIYQLMSAFMGPWGDYIFPSLIMAFISRVRPWKR